MALRIGLLLIVAGVGLFFYLSNMQVLLYTSVARLGESCIVFVSGGQDVVCMPGNIHTLGLIGSGLMVILGLIYMAKGIFQKPQGGA